MYIWLLISKAERQAAGARAKANVQNLPDICLKSGRNTPPAEKQGRGIALSRYRDNASPLPCFPAGTLERYRSHRTNHIADINKLLIEYQWNINGILTISRIISKWGGPLGGRTGAREQGGCRAGRRYAAGRSAPSLLPRGAGRGDCPDEPPCRVAGSGNSRDRYPAWGRGGAKCMQRAREKHSHKAYISKIMIIGYCR